MLPFKHSIYNSIWDGLYVFIPLPEESMGIVYYENINSVVITEKILDDELSNTIKILSENSALVIKIENEKTISMMEWNSLKNVIKSNVSTIVMNEVIYTEC